MALSDATREMLYLRSLCSSLGMEQPATNNLFSDNQGALAMTKGQGAVHSRSKHIDVRHHFVREQTAISYHHVSGADNPADIMTKPLNKWKHEHGLTLLSVD